MIILGLHFGHDAGAAVLVDGEIVSCVIRERQTRVKHAMTLDLQTISKALVDAGVNENQIDFCAITSTQGVELIVDDSEAFSISIDMDCESNVACQTTMDKLPVLSRRVFSILFSKEFLSKPGMYAKEMYSKYFPEFKDLEGKECEFSGWLDHYVSDDFWKPPKTLKELSSSKLSSEVKSDYLRFGFHYPASVSLQGCRLPAFLIHHHACHAASSYYQSGFAKAAILVQDGGNGEGYDSGMFYYAEKNKIYPIAPHHSVLGILYDQVASFMNLGYSSAGKLMGLAAYGRSSFYDSKFLGNWNDLANITNATDIGSVVDCWMHHCLKLAKDRGYDMEPFGDVLRMTAPINVDIAASTQKLFEENTLALVEILHSYLIQNKIVVDDLCLSGGNALNCPTNSSIYNKGPFKRVFVEPGCDDSGLAIGAALSCYHNLLDQPLNKEISNHSSFPFLGPRIAESHILSAIECFKDQLHCEKISGWTLDAARELEENHVIGWFHGRSEVGPRALGHRSILADARDIKNWERVNKIKKRELWRPFAPVVLQSEAGKWFSACPLPSPYMLFNAIVESKEIPAITHVDGTARIQTVNDNNGVFYDLLTEYFRLTGVPILLNTSFNGPSEPIVETPMDALKFFLDSELDTLYIDSYKIKRRSTSGADNNNKKCFNEQPKKTAFELEKFMFEFEIDQINRSQGSYQVNPEIILEGYKGFNLIAFRNFFFAIRQAIGNVDFNKDVASILQFASPGDIMLNRSLGDLLDDIDGFSLSIRLHKEGMTAHERAMAVVSELEAQLIQLAEEANNERQANNRAVDTVREEGMAVYERAMAVVSALEAQLTQCQKQIDEQDLQIRLLQKNWAVGIARVIKRLFRSSK